MLRQTRSLKGQRNTLAFAVAVTNAQCHCWGTEVTIDKWEHMGATVLRQNSVYKWEQRAGFGLKPVVCQPLVCVKK